MKASLWRKGLIDRNLKGGGKIHPFAQIPKMFISQKTQRWTDMRAVFFSPLPAAKHMRVMEWIFSLCLIALTPTAAGWKVNTQLQMAYWLWNMDCMHNQSLICATVHYKRVRDWVVNVSRIYAWSRYSFARPTLSIWSGSYVGGHRIGPGSYFREMRAHEQLTVVFTLLSSFLAHFQVKMKPAEKVTNSQAWELKVYYKEEFARVQCFPAIICLPSHRWIAQKWEKSILYFHNCSPFCKVQNLPKQTAEEMIPLWCHKGLTYLSQVSCEKNISVLFNKCLRSVSGKQDPSILAEC